MDKAASAPLTCTYGKKTFAGTFDVFKVKVKNTTSCASDPSPPSPCPSGDYVYGSASQLNEDAGFWWKWVPVVRIPWPPCYQCPPVDSSVDNTASSLAGTGPGQGDRPSTEVGIVLTGHLATSGESTEITSCFKSDTGPDTTRQFCQRRRVRARREPVDRHRDATEDGGSELGRDRLTPKLHWQQAREIGRKEGRGFGSVPLAAPRAVIEHVICPK